MREKSPILRMRQPVPPHRTRQPRPSMPAAHALLALRPAPDPAKAQLLSRPSLHRTYKERRTPWRTPAAPQLLTVCLHPGNARGQRRGNPCRSSRRREPAAWRFHSRHPCELPQALARNAMLSAGGSCLRTAVARVAGPTGKPGAALALILEAACVISRGACCRETRETSGSSKVFATRERKISQSASRLQAQLLRFERFTSARALQNQQVAHRKDFSSTRFAPARSALGTTCGNLQLAPTLRSCAKQAALRSRIRVHCAANGSGASLAGSARSSNSGQTI